jgi:hypothetical protein
MSNLKYKQFLQQVTKDDTNDNPTSDTSEDDKVDIHPGPTE